MKNIPLKNGIASKLAAFFSLLLVASSAYSATNYTWSSSVSSSWFTAGNWSPSGGPPGSTDIVVNPSSFGGAVIFGADATIGGINLTNLTSAWSISNTQASTTRTLTVNGDVSKAGAGNLSFRNNAAGQQLNVGIGGALNLSSGNLFIGDFGTGQDINSFNVVGLTTASAGLMLTRGNYTAITFSGGLSIGSSATVSASGMGAATSGTTGFTTAFLTGSGQLKANNGNAFSGTVLINGASGTSTFSGQVVDGAGGSGILSIVKSGNSTQVFSGSNTYTGGTTINGGTLALGNANALGTSGTITFGGGALQFSASNTTDYSSRIANSTAGAIAIDTNGQSVSFGALGSSNTGGLTKSGSGTLTLTGNNTYTGNTAVNSGTLALNSSGALADSVAVNVATGATFSISGITASSETIGSISGTSSSSVVLGAKNLTAGGNNSSTSFAGVISGSGGSLTKAGSGILTLGGSNTYTGSTTVSAGTLVISSGAGIGNGAVAVNGGSLTVNGSVGNGGVTVASGATLSGSGTIAGNVTLSGGTLAPGNSPGLLSVGSLTLSSGVTSFEISGTGRGTTYDAIDVANGGGVQFGGTFSLSFSSLLSNSTTLDLFSFNTASSGDFTALTSTGSYASAGWTRNASNDTWTLQSGSQTLTFSEVTGDLQIVPEPSAWALLAIGVTLSFTLRRRRKSGQN